MRFIVRNPYQRRRSLWLGVLSLALLTTTAPQTIAAQSRPDPATLTAPASAPWIRDAVIYELNTRTFTKAGTFTYVCTIHSSMKSVVKVS